MSLTVVFRAEPDKVAQSVRIVSASASDVMDLGHRPHPTMLADALSPLVHLLTPLRVHRIPPPSPIRYGPHRISLRSASSNVRLSTIEK